MVRVGGFHPHFSQLAARRRRLRDLPEGEVSGHVRFPRFLGFNIAWRSDGGDLFDSFDVPLHVQRFHDASTSLRGPICLAGNYRGQACRDAHRHRRHVGIRKFGTYDRPSARLSSKNHSRRGQRQNQRCVYLWNEDRPQLHVLGRSVAEFAGGDRRPSSPRSRSILDSLSRKDASKMVRAFLLPALFPDGTLGGSSDPTRGEAMVGRGGPARLTFCTASDGLLWCRALHAFPTLFASRHQDRESRG
mmetsp:Transcript_18927/g.40707  ORF Transcript_18927/g.40707 Transcript_18927/m.40707 type:complete len:246 (+) Transcript_18927:856-1593(+)